MDDYIEREDAIKLIFEQFHMYFEVPCLPRDEAIQRQVCEVRDKINEIQAADVAPVRHGRWLYHTLIDGHIHAECSECHKIRIIDNFCPNCGAKMDKESYCNRVPE